MKRAFRPADILIPQNTDMTAWSVVACDQFTSQPEYWKDVDKQVGDKPSALRLILPEAFLGKVDIKAKTEKINAAMKDYLKKGIFKEYKQSYIYVERTLQDGKIRRGVVGCLDLEEYDYAENSATPIRATEGTVEDRLPPRVKVREKAPLEMPHIMVFVDDEADTVMTAAAGGDKVYDFDLMQQGGHITGYVVPDNDKLDAAIDALYDEQKLNEKYHLAGKSPIIFAMGDGNHSLATAKKCWESLKPTLTDEEKENHPARFALVELVNIHDPAISFEPIHKVIFNTIPGDFLSAGRLYFKGTEGIGHTIKFISEGKTETICVKGMTIGEINAACERFCKRYMMINDGQIDYVHGDTQAMQMASCEKCCAVLMPAMKKSELFSSVIKSGPFPKKSFSIGLGPDKRYYLECRKIK